MITPKIQTVLTNTDFTAARIYTTSSNSLDTALVHRDRRSTRKEQTYTLAVVEWGAGKGWRHQAPYTPLKTRIAEEFGSLPNRKQHVNHFTLMQYSEKGNPC